MTDNIFDFNKILEFRSPTFARCKKDEELVNGDTLYGYAATKYILDRLPEYGFKPVDLFAEDWGWMCVIDNEEFELAFGCQADDEGNVGDIILNVIPLKPVVRKWFKKIDARPQTTKLAQAIFDIIEKCDDVEEGPCWMPG